MTFWEAVLLVVGGGLAGVINAMAGGGSTLTVPLLVLAGAPGNAANGSNRVGILTSNITTAASFHREGVTAYRDAVPVLIPVVIGSLIGSLAVSRVTDQAFETLFGLLMIPILFLSLRKPEAEVGPGTVAAGDDRGRLPADRRVRGCGPGRRRPRPARRAHEVRLRSRSRQRGQGVGDPRGHRHRPSGLHRAGPRPVGAGRSSSPSVSPPAVGSAPGSRSASAKTSSAGSWCWPPCCWPVACWASTADAAEAPSAALRSGHGRRRRGRKLQSGSRRGRRSDPAGRRDGARRRSRRDPRWQGREPGCRGGPLGADRSPWLAEWATMPRAPRFETRSTPMGSTPRRC